MAKSRGDVLIVIGVFKLVKAVTLFALGITALVAGPAEVASVGKHFVGWLGLFPGHHTLLRGVNKLWSLDSHAALRLELMIIGYGGIFSVEGTGLLLRRRWAEWFTVFVTGSFIPIEIYEVIVHFGWGKVAALIVNVFIVAYLIWRRVHDRGGSRDG
jgi:uncharacterized membrane protein (DUF2068 family)